MKKLFALIMVVFALALAACGRAAPEPLELTIEMSEYAYNPENIELRVGQQVTLNLVNTGQLEHELMIGRELVNIDNLPNGYQVDFFENADIEPVVETSGQMAMEEHEEDTHTHEEDANAEGEDSHTHDEDDAHTHEEEDGHAHEHSGFMVSLPQGNQQAMLTFTVTEDMVGEWAIGCFLEDGVHYEAGMHGTLVVRP